jgi:hypothetical protein
MACHGADLRSGMKRMPAITTFDVSGNNCSSQSGSGSIHS